MNCNGHVNRRRVVVVHNNIVSVVLLLTYKNQFLKKKKKNIDKIIRFLSKLAKVNKNEFKHLLI
jgi:hypothetical protein